MKAQGIAHFDAWADTFARVETQAELKASGQGYGMKERFRAFVNVAELM